MVVDNKQNLLNRNFCFSSEKDTKKKKNRKVKTWPYQKLEHFKEYKLQLNEYFCNNRVIHRLNIIFNLYLNKDRPFSTCFIVFYKILMLFSG